MNTKQIAGMCAFTSKIENIVNRHGKGSAGSMAWDVSKYEDGIIILSGSNAETTEWFQKYVSVTAVIGPRGGVKVTQTTGFAI